MISASGEDIGVAVLLAVMILFFVIGVVFLRGRGSSLIAGFNTKSLEEQGKYDVAALCRFMGKIMFALGFSMLFWVFGVASEVDWMFIVGAALFVAITLFAVTYINTGDRFKK